MNRAALTALERWHAAGQRCALATIVAVHRSAPLPAGTLMAVREDGASVGAVSGGCVEHEVIAVARRVAAGEPAQRLRFAPDADGLTGTGLPCGGGIDVWVEAWGSFGQRTLAAAVRADAHAVRRFALDDGTSFTQRVLPRPRVVMVGAGPLTDALCSQLAALERRTIVIDPRAAFSERSAAGADERHATWPAEALAAIGPLGGGDAVLALSHHPALDDEALRLALASGAGFVGALGSRAAHAERRVRLAELHGVAPADLERIAAPLGLDLGGWTTAETALAIAAELVAVGAGRAGGRLSAADAPRRIHGVRPAPAARGGAA